MTHDDHRHHGDHAHTAEPERLSYHQVMEAAVRELLVEKGVLTAAEIRAAVEAMDARTPVQGARVVARAWVDRNFRNRLLADGSGACGELGIDMGPTKLVVVANEPDVHNMIVCTLCSCYPRFLLGLPPDWYKSTAYRARTVRDPRAVLAEFGTVLPPHVAIRVHDSTADMRYMVLPMRPPGSEGLSEPDLAQLVSRDSMIGVAAIDRPAAAA